MNIPDKELKDIQKVVQSYAGENDHASVLFLEQTGTLVKADLKRCESSFLPQRSGAVVTLVRNGLKTESSSDYSHDAPALVNSLFENAQAGLNQYSASLTGLGKIECAEETRETNFPPTPFEDISTPEKIEYAQKTVNRIKGMDSSIVSARTLLRHTLNHEIYISGSQLLTQRLSRFEGIFLAALKNKDNAAQIFDGYGKPGGWENRRPPEGLLEDMVQDGIKILNAPRLKPGYYDCIFDPSLSGILAHEAFGHGTEADTMMRERAKGAGYLERRVASDLVCICDSPALEGAAASYRFDHEGRMASETCIIDRGVLKSPMTDLISAGRMGYTRTANGRRESYDHKVYTRMTNTYFRPGKHELGEMIASIDRGFYVTRATNGMEDPKGWGIQLEALMAREIVNGSLSDNYFSPVIVTGYVPEILESISMVSKDFYINGLGMCGKGHKEWVKVTDGGPFLKLRSRLA